MRIHVPRLILGVIGLIEVAMFWGWLIANHGLYGGLAATAGRLTFAAIAAVPFVLLIRRVLWLGPVPRTQWIAMLTGAVLLASNTYHYVAFIQDENSTAGLLLLQAIVLAYIVFLAGMLADVLALRRVADKRENQSS
ncbi:MAG: hypothetical protein WD757_05105 [Actinomycetota bacterium]